jgi:hypothetical protein
MTACCAKPAICTMDYDKFSPSSKGHWTTPKRMVNRVCTHCWTHWFGPESKVRQFTRAQWDKWINAAFAADRQAKTKGEQT